MYMPDQWDAAAEDAGYQPIRNEPMGRAYDPSAWGGTQGGGERYPYQQAPASWKSPDWEQPYYIGGRAPAYPGPYDNADVVASLPQRREKMNAAPTPPAPSAPSAPAPASSAAAPVPAWQLSRDTVVLFVLIFVLFVLLSLQIQALQLQLHAAVYRGPYTHPPALPQVFST